MVNIIKRKVGRPRKEKENETIGIKGRRGRPKKSEEILESRRTIRFKELYPSKKEKVKLRAGASPRDEALYSRYAEEWKEIYKEYAESQNKKENNVAEKRLKKHPLEGIEDIDDVKIELSPQIKQNIADEAMRMGEEQEALHRNLKIEEFKQANSHKEEVQVPSKIVEANDEEVSETHANTGKFKKGNPGGPGRTVGSRNRVSVALDEIGEENAMLGMQLMVSWMKSGDRDATKFLLERVYKGRKGTRRDLGEYEPVRTIEDINRISKNVIHRMVIGDISAEEAEDYLKALERHLKLMVDTEMAAKIENTCKQVELIKSGV